MVVFQNKKKAFSQAVPYEPASVAVHPSSPVVAVCGAKVSKNPTISLVYIELSFFYYTDNVLPSTFTINIYISL